MPKIIIVGAGISGLALAFRIRQRFPALEFQILEKEEEPGGKIQTMNADGFRFEAGPNGFLDNRPSTIQLCRDVGLENELIPASADSSRKRYLFLNGQLKHLPSGMLSFLKSDVLSIRGKLNLMLERFRKYAAPVRDESIHTFACRHVGREVADVFVDAIITGIHAGDPKLLSLQATFPHIADFEAQYGSILKAFAVAARQRRQDARRRGLPRPNRTRLWSLRYGLSQLIEALRGKLTESLHSNVSISNVVWEKNQWRVRSTDGQSWRCDAVALACPAYQQAAILSQLDGKLAQKVGDIPYSRIAVIALGYRRGDVPGGADGFGYIAPQRTRRDLLGVQWCSSIFSERAPADAVLMRAMAGGWHRPELVDDPDDVLFAKARNELQITMGIQSAPIFQRIVRWNRAIPQYHIGHTERVVWVQKRAGRFPGLFLAGNAYRGIALNDCTAQAEIVAERISQFFEGKLK